jgi:hypothetical protein
MCKTANAMQIKLELIFYEFNSNILGFTIVLVKLNAYM